MSPKPVNPEAGAKKPVKKSSAPPVPEIMKQGRLAPWLYLLPALLVMSFFIVYPMINTISLEFQQPKRYRLGRHHLCGRPAMLGDFRKLPLCPDSRIQHQLATGLWNSFWSSSYGNTIKWIVVMVFGTVSIGLGLRCWQTG
jgi:ABC-type sugar transport system permease subunit